MFWQVLLPAACIFASLPTSQTVDLPDLYPFGTLEGDHRLPPDQEDISSHEIRLKTPVKFYSSVYTTIYVITK